MSALIERFHSWVALAPWLVVIMLAAAVIIFLSVLRGRDLPGWMSRRAPVVKSMLEAIVLPLVFLLILWGVRVVLARVEADFRQQHGRVSSANLASVESIWGRPYVQRDLSVSHTYPVAVKERYRDDATGEWVERTRMEEREFPQNSLVQTRGAVTLTRSERRKGTAKYPGFILASDLRYRVKNLAPRDTTAHFYFPLSPEQSIAGDFQVQVDGADQRERLTFSPDSVTWSLPMAPGQETAIDVRYNSRGLQRYYYQISDFREIRDFELALALPDIPTREINYPEGCIPPTDITASADGRGSLLTWRLDRALTTRGMGIALPQPQQPGRDASRVLRYAWRGGMLLLVLIAVTGLALGRPFSLLRTALLAGVYLGEFMLLAAISDYLPSFWLAWAIAALGALLLAWLILGGRRAAWPQLAIAAVFYVLYPLLALPDEVNTALLTGVDVLAIVYLALLGAMALRRRPADDGA